jgi:hypothetical protein
MLPTFTNPEDHYYQASILRNQINIQAFYRILETVNSFALFLAALC